jgi:hypothetical protein
MVYNNTAATRGKNIVNAVKATPGNLKKAGSVVVGAVSGPNKVANLKKVGMVAAAPIAAPVLYAGKAAVVGADRYIKDRLTEAENFKVQGTENLGEYEKYMEKREIELRNVKQEEIDNKKFNAGIKLNLDTMTDATTDLTATMDEFVQTVKDMSSKDLEEKDRSEFLNEKSPLLAAMDNSKFDALLKSEKFAFNDTEKAKLKSIRGEQLKKWVTNAPVHFGKFIAKKGTSDIAEMPPVMLKKMAEKGLLTSAALDQVYTKGKMGDADRAEVRANIEGAFADQTNQAHITAAVAAAVARLSPQGGPLIDAEKVRISAADIGTAGITVTGETADETASRLEKIRRAVMWLQGGKGLNF